MCRVFTASQMELSGLKKQWNSFLVVGCCRIGLKLCFMRSTFRVQTRVSALFSLNGCQRASGMCTGEDFKAFHLSTPLLNRIMEGSRLALSQFEMVARSSMGLRLLHCLVSGVSLCGICWLIKALCIMSCYASLLL
jgi:hypothetical protein